MGLHIIRADEEIIGGIIHSLMFERLVFADIAIVDMSNQNANVCYELGFRHCARSHHTIIIFDQNSKLPFDFSFERAIPYKLNRGVLSDENALELKEKIKERLKDIKEHNNIQDSPAFELIEDFPETELAEKNTTLYRKKSEEYERIINKLNNSKDKNEINSCIEEINSLELSLKVLAYYIIENFKRIKDWTSVINFINRGLGNSNLKAVYFKQQLSIAYNKRGSKDDKQKAINILECIIKNDGESSETYGLLGSIYKTLYETETNSDKKFVYLDLSIENYRKGFNMDINDYYPGINLATLLLKKYCECQLEETLQEMKSILAIVKYDLKLQDVYNSEDYWLLATAYETSILDMEFKTADCILDKIFKLYLKGKIEDWKKETTLKNLFHIKVEYEKCKKTVEWYTEFRDKLEVKEESYVLD